MNLPLHSWVHSSPLVVCLIYLGSRLAPAGSQTSLFGLITIPVIYLPFALIGLDLITSGPRAAAASITGAVAGHLWWWGVHDSRALEAYARAPAFLRDWIDGPPRPGPSRATGGVYVSRPRTEELADSTGHKWGSGQRLGSG